MDLSRKSVIVAVAIIAFSLTIEAHDFWLIPDAFTVTSGAHITVRGQTSSAFPTSESAVTVDRLTSARVIGASDEEEIRGRRTDKVSLLLDHKPSTPGQKIVAVAVGWRHVKETADSFRKYLVAEGAEAALQHHEQAGTLPTAPIVRRYAKYAKTVVEVGTGPRAFHRAAGHPLEFIPIDDPSSVRANSTIRFRLMLNGAALAGARIHAGVAAEAKGPKDQELTTDAQGVAALRAATPGMWNVRTIHVMPAPRNVDADWEVHWATFVFPVGQ